MDPLRLDPAVQRRILLKIGLGFALALVAAKIVPGGGGSTFASLRDGKLHQQARQVDLGSRHR